MCGIAGYIGSRQVEEKLVDNCLRLMRRRGPDDHGVYRHTHVSGQNLLLLHSRLEILDLDDRASQPMRYGDNLLCFNGELYNYIELRGVVGNTRPYETTGDTEVLLRALSERGLEVLDQCEGMWAFAFYNETSGELVLSRDRFGEKPLYFCRGDDGIYFASQIGFLRALTARSFSINYGKLHRYLVNGYKDLYKSADGFFDGVSEVPPGHFMSISPGRPEETRSYWSPSYEQSEDMAYEEAVSQARSLLIKSMELRLRSDVPLAFCMSGGVDSNSLISIARNVLGVEVHGFTIMNEDSRYAEKDLVEAAVSQQGLRHTPIALNKDSFLPNLRKIIQNHCSPICTISYYLHWLLLQSIAGHGYKVAISGTGADELFSGYYDHHNLYLAAIRGIPDLYEESLRNWKEHIAPIIRNPLLQDPECYVKNPAQRSHIFLNADMFSEFLAVEFDSRFTEESYVDDLLRNRMLNELFQEAVPCILHEDDLNSMYHSVENRSPFLDRPLFEFCNTIPTRHLIRDGFNKKILRDAMQGIVPDDILSCRRKVGFNAPINSLLNKDVPEVRDMLLSPSPIFDHVKRSAIEKMLDKAALENSESKFLFYFVCAKLFLEEFE